MPLTQITDIVTPEVFTDYVQLLTTDRSAFIASGVVETSPFFDGLLAGGGQTFNIPHFKDLDNTPANISTDLEGDFGAPGNNMIPLKTTTGREIAIRLSRNQGWSSADLAGDLAGADPMESIASRVADYWVREQQRILIASLQGVMADNAANGGDDMLIDITNGTGTVTAEHLFSAEVFIDAVQTMGDAGEELVAIAVHSVVYRRMQKNNLIDFIEDSNGVIKIPTFLGRRVIVDDSMPKILESPNFRFSSYLFGAGSVALGVGSARVPTAVERDERAGGGGGVETLHNRVEWLFHPRGFQFNVGSIVLESPTDTELRAAAGWTRSDTDRKLVKFAELRTNG